MPLAALFWFVLVVAAIPLALWLLKRTPIGGGGGSGGPVRQVAVLPLSASQRLVTVEVGRGDSRCWLVLGVTPHSITTLHTLLPQDEAAPGLPSTPATPQTAFSQLLGRLRQPGGGRDAH